jgi:hypothetical protein
MILRGEGVKDYFDCKNIRNYPNLPGIDRYLISREQCAVFPGGSP